jgi:hypothetical protein
MEWREDIQDNMDQLVMSICSAPSADETMNLLTLAHLNIDEETEMLLKEHPELKRLYDLGRLQGALELGGRVVYEAKSDARLILQSAEFKNYPHLNELVLLLYNNPCMHDRHLYIALKFQTFEEFQKYSEQLINEPWFERLFHLSFAFGLTTAFSLTDTGLRYGKLLLNNRISGV